MVNMFTQLLCTNQMFVICLNKNWLIRYPDLGTKYVLTTSGGFYLCKPQFFRYNFAVNSSEPQLAGYESVTQEYQSKLFCLLLHTVSHPIFVTSRIL